MRGICCGPLHGTEIAQAGGATVAAIVMQPWFGNMLAASGFENRQQVVMLEWRYQPWVGTKRAESASEIWWRLIFPKSKSWTPHRLSRYGITHWRRFAGLCAQALIATVAEDEHGNLAGYQLSTGGGGRAHLARLAVHPSMQGRGVGRALLG